MSRKLYFSEYSEGVQAHFKDLKDVHTFGKVCIDTYKISFRDRLLHRLIL